MNDSTTATSSIDVETDTSTLEYPTCDNCGQEATSRTESQPVRYLPYPHVSVEQWCRQCSRTIFPWTRRYLPIKEREER